jgi:hypothetical protein
MVLAFRFKWKCGVHSGEVDIVTRFKMSSVTLQQ